MPPLLAVLLGGGLIGLAGPLGLHFLVPLGYSLILSGASQALAPKPKQDHGLTNRSSTVRQPISPRRILFGRVKVGGVITFLQSSVVDTVLTMVVTVSGHPIHAFDAVYLGDEPIPLNPANVPHAMPDNRWYQSFQFFPGLGTEAGDANLLYYLRQNTNGLWTEAHSQSGCAKFSCRFQKSTPGNLSLFASGVPNPSVILRGALVYDPRDVGQDYNDPDTWLYSTNFALCLLYYMIGYAYAGDGVTRCVVGLGEGLAGIDLDNWIAQANICDEPVPLAAGGTEPRYTCNGEISLDRDPEDIIRSLCTAAGATCVRSGGKWRLYVAAWEAPTVTLTESDLDGPIKVLPRLSRRDVCNTVRATFLSPQKNWQPTDAKVLRSSTFIAEDGGDELSRDLNLPFTSTHGAAQRLQKIELLKSRQQITGTWPCKLTTFKTLAGLNVGIDFSGLGWSGKYFRIYDWELKPRGEGNDMRLGIDLLLRETAAEIFDWNSSEEKIEDPAPDTDLPDPLEVLPPGAPAVTEELYTTRDGSGVKAKANLSWLASEDSFLQDYEVQMKLSSSSEWISRGRVSTNLAEVLDMAPGTYDFQVQAVNSIGARSVWAISSNIAISGLSAPPSDVGGLTISVLGGLVVLRWDQSPDLDVRVGGEIVFRHSPDPTSATWTGSTSIGEAVAGSSTSVVLPLKPGTYLVRSRDSTGNLSENDATAKTDGATVLEYASVTSLVEEPVFSGDHANTAAPDGYLKLDSLTDLDDVADVDALPDWDSSGGLAATGVYSFSGGLDLGSVLRVRLRSYVDSMVVNVLENMDDWPGNVDDRPDWDGVAAADGSDCQVWFRQTNDNPAGSPTWSDWNRLDSAEVFARGFEFEARVHTESPNTNVHVSALRVYVEELV